MTILFAHLQVMAVIEKIVTKFAFFYSRPGSSAYFIKIKISINVASSVTHNRRVNLSQCLVRFRDSRTQNHATLSS